MSDINYYHSELPGAPVLNGTARPTGKLPLLTLTKAAE